jgi:hypothetical protein
MFEDIGQLNTLIHGDSLGNGYRKSLHGVHFDHPPQQVLAVRRHKMGNMEDALLHLLQKVAQIVVIEWERPLNEQVLIIYN